MPSNKLIKCKYKGQDAVIGTSGEVESCAAIEKWVKGGCKGKPKLPDEPQYAAMIVTKDGDVFLMSGSTFPHEMGKVKWAIGSGCDYALGAMAAGKTAKEAVEIASTLDVGTGLGVDVVVLKGRK